MDEGNEQVEERSALVVRHRMDRLRRSFLTAAVAPMGGNTATVPNDVPEEQESHVSLSEPSRPASLTKSPAWDVEIPCAPADATPSQSSSAAPMTWKELTDHAMEMKPRSSTVLVTRKPLRFKTREEWTKRRLKEWRWRYAPLNEALGEDK
jgi:hypothetical protein